MLGITPDVSPERAERLPRLSTKSPIFTISYSLAMLFRHWGARPQVMTGHSIGEFVAATLAGVIERDDALRLVATRGRLMHDLPAGSMLTVRLPVAELLERLPSGVDLAAVNAPALCVAAGPREAIDSFAEQLTAGGVMCRKLHTSHAFHSAMMEPAVEPFLRAAERMRLSPPRMPYVSTVTGDWIKASEATSPEYWARHLRSPVQFSKALQRLLNDHQRVLLELGPRRTSATLALQHAPRNPDRIIGAMPAGDADDECASVLLALGSLWMNGCRVDWPAFHEGETRRRVPLPTYPFQRRRYWIEPGTVASFATASSGAAAPAVQASATPSPPAPAERASADGVSPAVVALLEELLGHPLEGLDPDTRFVTLGIDSLLLTQLARAVRTRLGFEVTFRQLNEKYSTPRLLIDAIRASGPREAQPGPAASAVARPDTATRRIELVHPVGGDAYGSSIVIRLRGAVSDDALLRALRTLPERHPALRAHPTADGRGLLVEPTLELSVRSHDLTRMPPAEREAAAQRLVVAEAGEAFDLERGPMFRAAVVKTADDARSVVLSVHDSVCDGWSLDVLVDDLGCSYSAFVAGRPRPAAPAHTLQDHVAFRSTAEYRARVASCRAFWRKVVEDTRSRPPIASRGAGPAVEARRELGADLVRLVESFSRSHELSVFAVLLSALAVTVHRESGDGDVVVATPLAGHPEAGMEDCVGPLARLAPLKLKVDGRRSFLELCRATHATIVDAIEQSPGLDGLGDEGEPLSDSIVFTHVKKYPLGKVVFTGCAFDYDLGPRSHTTSALEVDVFQSVDSLGVRARGPAERFDQTALDRLAGDLADVLRIGCSGAASSQARKPAASRTTAAILAEAARAIATRYKLRRCAAVGEDARVVGRVWIWGGGRIVLGKRVVLDASRAPIELHAEEGAEITIGDDVVIEGGTSLEATSSISIGPRSHLGMQCKIMDNNFHGLDDRLERPPAKPVVVEEDVELGRGVILLPGAQVGERARVKDRTVVGRVIEPGALVRGSFLAASLGGRDAE